MFTVLSWQANWASQIIVYITTHFNISLGNLAEKKTEDGMNAQHKYPCFSLKCLAYTS